MKTSHKLGISGIVALIAIFVIAGSLGAFTVIHNLQSEKKDMALVSESVSVKTGSGHSPVETSNIGDSVRVQATGASMPVTNTDDMISYNPLSPHVVLHSQAEQDQFLATHHGVYGIVHVLAKHADGTTFVDFRSTNSREIGGINCILSIGFTASTGLGNNGTNFRQACGGNGTAPATAYAGPNIYSGSTHWGGFNDIALFNGSSGSSQITPNGTDTASDDSTYGNIEKLAGNANGGGRAGTTSGMVFGNGFTISSSASLGQGGPLACTVAGTATTGNSAAQQLTCTSGTFNFIQLRAAGTTIRGVALLNNTKTPATIFAENGFTPITVANTDTLQITWTISLSFLKGIMADAFVMTHYTPFFG